MRIGSPPIMYACPYLGFTASKSALELITRRTIKEIEGDDEKDLDKYSTTDSAQYNNMIDSIRKKLHITTLKFMTVEDLLDSIGLPDNHVCTYCYNKVKPDEE